MESTNPLQFILEQANPLLIYGEAATGKTHLAYESCKIIKQLNKKCYIIATEPGTTLFLREKGEEYIYAKTLDELSKLVTFYATQKHFIIIDSINWHYRSNPQIMAARHLSYISAILRETGGIAVAQVTGEGTHPSGYRFLIPWFRGIAYTKREATRRSLFMLELIRPFRRMFAFTICDGRIKWL